MFSARKRKFAEQEVNYSTLWSLEGGEVKAATLDGEKVMFKGADGKEYVTIVPAMRM